MHRVVGLGRFKLYYANRRTFVSPGFYLWTGKQHVRLLPIPKFGAHP